MEACACTWGIPLLNMLRYYTNTSRWWCRCWGVNWVKRDWTPGGGGGGGCPLSALKVRVNESEEICCSHLSPFKLLWVFMCVWPGSHCRLLIRSGNHCMLRLQIHFHSLHSAHTHTHKCVSWRNHKTCAHFKASALNAVRIKRRLKRLIQPQCTFSTKCL